MAVDTTHKSGSNYQKQGGDVWEIGNELNILSGGEIDVESGGSLKIAGTAMTSSAAELNVLDGVTAGTVTLSKAVVVDANKDIGDFRNLDAVNIDLGSSGAAGTVDIFPTTASKGKLIISATDNTGNDNVTITNAAHGQATTVTIPDGGAATSYVVQSTAALTLAEADVLDSATAGTQVASKAVIADANINIGVTKVTELHIGATGAETQVTATGAELNLLDLSAQSEAITEAGAVSVVKRSTTLNSAGGTYAVTLAAPDATMLGQVKVIEMTTAGNDVTMALTNVQGGSAATTATFNAVDETLILVAGTNKWNVIKEVGVTLT